jgi:hypothetical protein
VTVLEGRALSVWPGLRFHPRRPLRLGGLADDDEADAQAKLRAALAGIMPEAECDEVFPFVATMMGLRPSGERTAQIRGDGGELVGELIVKHMRQVLRRLADARPTMLVFETCTGRTSRRSRLEALMRLTTRHALLFARWRGQAPHTSTASWRRPVQSMHRSWRSASAI